MGACAPIARETTMTIPNNTLALAEWRRTVSEMYRDVRKASQTGRPSALEVFRARRDRLFASHPQSPLDEDQLGGFDGLPYFAYNPAWRMVGRLDTSIWPESRVVQLDGDGEFRYTRVVQAVFTVAWAEARLNLYWIEGYGGGLFLPFGDATNGGETYGGGRYLYDTIKGADLGVGEREIVLDFNYAYNPSCAYNSRWVCPLSPPENRLPFAVKAGELRFPFLSPAAPSRAAGLGVAAGR
jgi:uncharacterized protein (DUF1684 family)